MAHVYFYSTFYIFVLLNRIETHYTITVVKLDQLTLIAIKIIFLLYTNCI